MLDPQTIVFLLGIAGGIFILLLMSAAHGRGVKHGFDTGYKEGYHDRQHWETDEVVKARIWYGEKKP